QSGAIRRNQIQSEHNQAKSGARTFMARAPNSSVPTVSDTSAAPGDTHTTSDVLQLPPSASESM
ncbi:MAG: hypothetical protein ACK56F_08675, partial [bacterium]